MQPKTFLIKKSSGAIFNLYHSITGGICYRLYSLHNNHRVDPFEISITEEKILEFHANIDEQDNIHILCLTENGDLKHYIDKEDQWTQKVLSHFDLRSNIIRSLFVSSANGKVYVLYAASNLMNINLWTIYFKAWDGTKWHSSNIGMTICDRESVPYLATTDSQHNLHIVYKNAANKGTQLYYRKYHSQFSLYTTPEKIINTSEVIGYYCIFCDVKDQLHIAWCTGVNHTYKMLYKKISTKVMNHKQVTRVIGLDTGKESYQQPVLLAIDQKLWGMWKCQGEFYACEIEQSGRGTSTPIPVQYASITPPILAEYASNYELEKSSLKAHLLYGISGETVELLLPKSYTYDFYESAPQEPPELPSQLPLPQEDAAPEAIVFDESSSQLQQLTPQTVEQPPVEPIINEIEYIEPKLDPQKVVKILEEVQSQLSTHDNQDILKLLEEIRTQNALLTELITHTLEKNAVQEAIPEAVMKSEGVFKKVFNIFR